MNKQKIEDRIITVILAASAAYFLSHVVVYWLV